VQFSNLVTGEFPPEVSLMKSTLQILDVGNNPVYSNGSALWPFLGQMTQLTDLRTDRTNFATTNGIPAELANLQKLRYFLCESSLYKGPLSGSAFPMGLSVLTILDIEANDFSGSTIPFEIGLLPSLENFYIRASNVTGNLNYMTNMKHIVETFVDNNQGLTGTIPTELGQLTNLASFSTTECSFTGTLPSELGNLGASVRKFFKGVSSVT